ncbi:MAG: alkaline phosphatase D family protein [Nocardioides sp.]
MAGYDDVRARREVFALGVLLVLFTVVTTLAAFSSPPSDEAIYLVVRDEAVLSGLDFLDWFVALPAVLVLALPLLLAWQCRVVLGGTAVAVGLGVGLSLLLQELVARPRPFDSSATGTDSYPVTVLVVLAVLLTVWPLWMRVARLPRGWSALAVGVLGLIALGAGVRQVEASLRWPLDVLGGLLLGAILGVVVRLGVHSESLHRRCSECVWQVGPPEPRPVRLPQLTARQLQIIAVVWAVVLALVLGALGLTRGIPRLPESGVMGNGLEVPLTLALVALIVIGTVVAVRWHLAGSLVVAFAACLLGYASSAEYAPWVAVVVVAVAFAPALLLWIGWHRHAPLRAALAVAVVTSVMVGTTIWAASATYSDYWGPTHPTSATPAVQDDRVDWMWAGGVTPSSVTVVARTEDDAAEVRLVVGTGENLAVAVRSGTVASDADTQNVVRLEVSGLAPDTDYYYGLELDGLLDTARLGRFTTFPVGPASFTFAVGADARTGSNGTVFDAVRRTDPLLFLNLGDFFYGDVDRNDADLYRRQYDANLTAPAQAALYAAAPIAYTWGDHDYAANDGDSTAVGRPSALAVYRQYVPHYALPEGTDSPLFQAFTVGDVRFVLTDNRSARDPAGTAGRSMLGAEQRRWLLRELARADRYGLVVWGNADPWVDAPDPTADTWAGFEEERGIIADALARHDVDNLLMVSGDAHMLAWDDGTNTDYSTDRVGGFPLLQAAALDRRPSVKGGPYTGPVLPGGGQFASVRVQDDGETVRVTVVGRNYRDEELFTRAFTRNRGE